MIQLSSAGKRYGHKLLFEGADWLITPQDRVGLVGANGTGKSTLLKILAGTGDPRLRHDQPRQGHQRRISAAGWAALSGRTRVCRVHVGVRRLRRHGAGDGSAHRRACRNWITPLRNTRRSRTAISASSMNSTLATDMPSRRRSARCYWAWVSAKKTGRGRRKNFPAAGRCASRWPNCCCKSQICCCWMSRPTILISKRATGWKNISTTIPTPSC